MLRKNCILISLSIIFICGFFISETFCSRTGMIYSASCSEASLSRVKNNFISIHMELPTQPRAIAADILFYNAIYTNSSSIHTSVASIDDYFFTSVVFLWWLTSHHSIRFYQYVQLDILKKITTAKCGNGYDQFQIINFHRHLSITPQTFYVCMSSE